MTEELIELPDVAQLSRHCVRILGQNPGLYTLQGTNTYVISGKTSVLLDTGEGEEDYIPHLRTALRDRPQVTDVILTHWHHDHVQGLPDTLRVLDEVQKGTSPRVWKMPSQGPDHDASVDEWLKQSSGRFIPAPSSSIHQLTDGHVFDIGGSTLRVVHTPGHTDDSVSLLFEVPGSSEPLVIFTADTVLGQGTTVFEDLAAYLASLKRLVDLCPTASKTSLYPGHGPVIEDGRPRMQQYISHRMEREEQVVATLKATGNDTITPEELVRRIYPSSLPDTVVPSAARGLLQHLQKLQKEGRVQASGNGWRIVKSQL